jgi:hypothetical protein
MSCCWLLIGDPQEPRGWNPFERCCCIVIGILLTVACGSALYENKIWTTTKCVPMNCDQLIDEQKIVYTWSFRETGWANNFTYVETCSGSSCNQQMNNWILAMQTGDTITCCYLAGDANDITRNSSTLYSFDCQHNVSPSARIWMLVVIAVTLLILLYCVVMIWCPDCIEELRCCCCCRRRAAVWEQSWEAHC